MGAFLTLSHEVRTQTPKSSTKDMNDPDIQTPDRQKNTVKTYYSVQVPVRAETLLHPSNTISSVVVLLVVINEL